MLSPPSFFAEVGREPFDLADTGRESVFTSSSTSLIGTFAELGREDLAEFDVDLFADPSLVVSMLGDLIETWEPSVVGFEGGSSGELDGSRSTVRAEAGLDDFDPDSGLV